MLASICSGSSPTCATLKAMIFCCQSLTVAWSSFTCASKTRVASAAWEARVSLVSWPKMVGTRLAMSAAVFGLPALTVTSKAFQVGLTSIASRSCSMAASFPRRATRSG